MADMKIPIPEFDGDYIHVYIPESDVYEGVNTESFKNGERYNEWIPNDFSIMRDGNTWHMVGITHPRPSGFIDAFNYEGWMHEAEYQLFHCTAQAESFSALMKKGSFCDERKILYPQARPGESYEIWAPHLMKRGDEFYVIYSPQKMRLATSRDFVNWKIQPPLFTCDSPMARDPYIFEENGKFYLIFTCDGILKYRVSEDMKEWGEEVVLQGRHFDNCEKESPFLLKRDGYYYLFWSMCDGRNGCYDHRTIVFAADSLEGLKNTAPITMLKAHAPEILVDTNGDYYLLSVYYPNNGISAVKLKWV